MTKFRPADVACLLSASNRRADIVRATPIRSSTESRRAKSRGLPDRYMEHLARHFHAADDRLRWRETRNGPAESPKPGNNWRPMPINFFSARVAPGLRTQTFAGDQSWPVQPSGPASYRATGERRLYRAKSGGKPAIRSCTAPQRHSLSSFAPATHAGGIATAGSATTKLEWRIARFVTKPEWRCARKSSSRWFALSDGCSCLTLSPRPPDQSGDPASSYRIGAVFLTGR